MENYKRIHDDVNGKVIQMKVTIRKMKKRDIPAVQEIAKTSWNSTYEGIIPLNIQEDFLSKAYSVKMLKKRRRKTNFFVALADDKLVGFANYSKVFLDKTVHLHAVYLDPEYQGKGIGSKLIQVGTDELAAKEITLNVERQNKQALEFYHAKGFEKISEFDDDFDGHTIHTIRMILKTTD